MKVITLNKEAFLNNCSELIEKVNEHPDIIVGILTGGGYILDAIKSEKGFESIRFEEIKLQRPDDSQKENYFFKYLLKIMPYVILNNLRKLESLKAKQSLNNLNLNELSNWKVDFKFNSKPEKPVKSILIIDDAIDTGRTMFVIKNNLQKMFPVAQIKVAVISWTLEASIITPDYFIFKNILVRYPWSKDYKGKDFEKKSFSS